MLQRLILLSALVWTLAAGAADSSRAAAPKVNTVTSESIVRLPEATRAKQTRPLFTTVIPEGIGGINDRQEIACAVRVTRDGKGVKGVKGQYILRGFANPDPVVVIRQGRSRASKQGWLSIPIIEVNGTAYDSVIVQTTLNTSKKVDTIFVRCQHRDYDPCEECFGPGDRFMLQGLPGGWVLDGPGEAVNGGERWTFEVDNKCKSGGHIVDISSSPGSSPTLNGVTILDTRTGVAVGDNPTATASYADGDQIVSSATCP